MCWQVHQLRDSGASQNTLSAVARRRAPLSADERGELLGEEALPGALQMQVRSLSTLASSSEVQQREVLWGVSSWAGQATAAGWPSLASTCSNDLHLLDRLLRGALRLQVEHCAVCIQERHCSRLSSRAADNLGDMSLAAAEQSGRLCAQPRIAGIASR